MIASVRNPEDAMSAIWMNQICMRARPAFCSLLVAIWLAQTLKQPSKAKLHFPLLRSERHLFQMLDRGEQSRDPLTCAHQGRSLPSWRAALTWYAEDFCTSVTKPFLSVLDLDEPPMRRD